LAKNISNEKGIGLKEIAEDITYVKLEKNPDCILGSIGGLVATEKYFFIDDKEIYQFLRTGEFIRKIGK
jgi:hypothetical protein